MEKEIQECGACGFKDNQDDIIETPFGYFHQECMDDAENTEERYSPQREIDRIIEEEKAYNRTEADSHLHS